MEVHTSAIRMQRRRQRQRQGLACFTVEADEVFLTQALIAAGQLDPSKADEKAEITRALTRFVEIFILENAK
jgi:hypothetical protein